MVMSPRLSAGGIDFEERLAGAVPLFETFDNFAGLRNALRHIARDKDEWAGIPMPLSDAELVVEPTYPNATALMAMTAPDPEEELPEGVVVRNQWWSHKLRRQVFVWQEPDGKVKGWAAPYGNKGVNFELATLGASVAWGIEQEANAVRLLGQLLKHHAFKMYLLTGMFLETSKRSGVTYLFRKLRPTVAIDSRCDGKKSARVLAALCLHPIGYYKSSWAGAMCPTDDVIAHLMLMRGDEAMFWRRANQHAPGTPAAAI